MSSTNNSNWTWSIPNIQHSNTGFWQEAVSANHAFCEPHYGVTPYIAEFFNSTSSIIYIILALVVKFPNDKLLTIARMWLAAVGIGSCLFHGTMRHVFQLTDEIPMVGFLATLAIAKISAPHPWLQTHIFIANTLVILYSIALMTIYIIMNEYEVFIHGFTFFVLVDTVLTLTSIDTKSKLQVRAYIVSLISIVVGRVAWESEHVLCGKYPSVWPLHVVWHVLSCTSAYAAMVTVYVIRIGNKQKNGRNTQELPRFVGFGDLIDAGASVVGKED